MGELRGGGRGGGRMGLSGSSREAVRKVWRAGSEIRRLAERTVDASRGQVEGRVARRRGWRRVGEGRMTRWMSERGRDD